MDRYIGVDAHASSCTLGVVGPSGKHLGSHVVETNARALIEVLRGIPKNRHVCLEEGTLSGWLHEVLEPHVEELVVTGVRKSRGPKSDKRDAFALAEQLRIGAVETRVYKGRGHFILRCCGPTYTLTVRACKDRTSGCVDGQEMLNGPESRPPSRGRAGPWSVGLYLSRAGTDRIRIRQSVPDRRDRIRKTDRTRARSEVGRGRDSREEADWEDRGR